MSNSQEQQINNSDANKQPETQTLNHTTNSEAVTINLPPKSNLNTENVDYNILSNKMRFDPLSVLFALFILSGGLLALIHRGSVPSIVASSIFTLLIGFATYFEGVKKNLWPLIGTTILFVVGMGHRYSQKWDFLPAGLYAVVGLLMLFRYAYLFKERSLKQKA